MYKIFQKKLHKTLQYYLCIYCTSNSMKRIEILLSHIKDKNKLINDFLFYLVQCFKTFLIKKINILCILWFNVSRLFISHTYTQNSLHFNSLFSPLALLSLYIYIYIYIYIPITLHVITCQIYVDKK